MNFVSLIGTTAAVLTTAAFLPQAIRTIRTKETRDLSLGMLITQTTGNLAWITYGYCIADVPLFAANIVTFSLVATILALKIRHK